MIFFIIAVIGLVILVSVISHKYNRNKEKAKHREEEARQREQEARQREQEAELRTHLLAYTPSDAAVERLISLYLEKPLTQELANRFFKKLEDEINCGKKDFRASEINLSYAFGTGSRTCQTIGTARNTRQYDMSIIFHNDLFSFEVRNLRPLENINETMAFLTAIANLVEKKARAVYNLSSQELTVEKICIARVLYHSLVTNYGFAFHIRMPNPNYQPTQEW